jgi:8-oxo-dGTP pyrophosphatase MutT (NUDIX family)
MSSPDDFIGKVKGRLTSVEPSHAEERMASVAMILKGRVDTKTLMIKRAKREGDPWSGQVAFPGGRMEKGDVSLRDTAIREVREEVGLDLGSSGTFLGYFGTFRTHTETILVSPCVFLLETGLRVRPNQEVSSFRWVPVQVFGPGGVRATYRLNRGGSRVNLPAYRYRDFTIWGLTHRIISSLVEDQ